MISVVVTDKGNIRGYIVENIYIKRDFLRYLSPEKTLYGVHVFGQAYGSDIKVRGKKYLGVMRYLTLSGIKELIRAFVLNGIKMNDVIFLNCKIDDIVDVMSDVWRVIGNFSGLSVKYVAAVDSNSNILGYMMSRSSVYSSTSYYINMIETTKKREGYGYRIVSQLHNLGKTISGLSVVDAVPFWEKCGADFEDSLNFIISN